MLKHHLSFIFTTKAERGIAAPAYDLTSVEFGAFFCIQQEKGTYVESRLFLWKTNAMARIRSLHEAQKVDSSLLFGATSIFCPLTKKRERLKIMIYAVHIHVEM